MDRRTFVDAGAGASFLGVLALAETSPLSAWSPSLAGRGVAMPPDLDQYLGTMDRGLESIATGDLSNFAPRDSRSLGNSAPLARSALRALYLTGMLGDLPYEAQVDPRVQERLWRMAPEVDETVSAMMTHLDERTSSEWADLQQVLRRRSNPAMAIAEGLTTEAAMAGLSRTRRLQTRAMITHVSLRLRSQPPKLVVQEYVEKVERVLDSDGFEVMARRNLAARLGEEAYWQLGAGSERQTPRGLKTLGWGFVITAVGGLVVAAGAFPGVFVMTAGVITMLVGLIQLIVHAFRS